MRGPCRRHGCWTASAEEEQARGSRRRGTNRAGGPRVRERLQPRCRSGPHQPPCTPGRSRLLRILHDGQHEHGNLRPGRAGCPPRDLRLCVPRRRRRPAGRRCGPSRRSTASCFRSRTAPSWRRSATGCAPDRPTTACCLSRKRPRTGARIGLNACWPSPFRSRRHGCGRRRATRRRCRWRSSKPGQIPCSTTARCCMGTDGCGMYWHLIVTGPQRGHVWQIAGEGAMPFGTQSPDALMPGTPWLLQAGQPGGPRAAPGSHVPRETIRAPGQAFSPSSAPSAPMAGCRGRGGRARHGSRTGGPRWMGAGRTRPLLPDAGCVMRGCQGRSTGPEHHRALSTSAMVSTVALSMGSVVEGHGDIDVADRVQVPAVAGKGRRLEYLRADPVPRLVPASLHRSPGRFCPIVDCVRAGVPVSTGIRDVRTLGNGVLLPHGGSCSLR
ncbi:hypothetical protein STANM309S_06406 [Streptomyces tanashiensis]